MKEACIPGEGHKGGIFHFYTGLLLPPTTFTSKIFSARVSGLVSGYILFKFLKHGISWID